MNEQEKDDLHHTLALVQNVEMRIFQAALRGSMSGNLRTECAVYLRDAAERIQRNGASK